MSHVSVLAGLLGQRAPDEVGWALDEGWVLLNAILA